MCARPDAGTRQNLLETGQRLIAGRGFSAVGLSEIVTAAGVPKGSFYHYFGSKDAFGEAVLDRYFEDYLADLDEVLGRPGPVAERILAYWRHWRATQSYLDYQGKCLAVKLGAEVADLSEPMRLALDRGTAAAIDRLERAVTGGVADGSVTIGDDPRVVARSLYQLWLGASVMAKIVRSPEPFETATATTHRVLGLTS